MIDLILNEPQLLFSLALTAKTCLVTLALFLVAGPLAGYYLARAPGVAPRVLGFVITIPLVVRPLQAAFASPRLIELEEAARIHGASRRDVFLRVTLPFVRPIGSAASRARWASP